MKSEEINVDSVSDGLRLDVFLSGKFSDFSRTYFQKLIKAGNVEIDDRICESPKTSLKAGSTIKILWPETQNRFLKAEKIPLSVIYEDDSILVINKAPGIVIHPAAGNYSGTIVNALLGKDANFAEKLDGSERPGIVHRLDRDTSGCLVIAKNPSSHFKLAKYFSERKVKKVYAALTYGHPTKDNEEIITLIGRHPVNRKKMSVLKNGDLRGRQAITSYHLIKKGFIDEAPAAFLSVEIKTGRTHQIRVHLAHRKIPVLGDKVYGGKQKPGIAPRQMLHAWKIEFPHPGTGIPVSFEAPLPEDFSELLKKIIPSADED